MNGYKSRSLVVLLILLAGMLLARDSFTWFAAPTSYANLMALCATIPNSVAVFLASLGANGSSVSSVALEPLASKGMVSFPPSPPQDSGAPTSPPAAVPMDSIPLHAMDQALPVAMLNREANARIEQATTPLGDMELAVIIGLSVLGLGAVAMWLHSRAPNRRARYVVPVAGASEGLGTGTGTSEGMVVIRKSVDRVRILPTQAREQTGQTTHGRVAYRAGQIVHQPVSVVSEAQLRVPERREAWV